VPLRPSALHGRSVAAVAAMICGVAACADVAGLDGLVEDECASGCTDAAQPAPDAGDVLDGANDHAAADSSIVAAEDAAGHDAATADATAIDASAPDTSSPDARVDATPDAADLDVAAPDAPPVEASTPDSGSPCGTVFLSEPFSNNAHGWTLDTSWSIAATCATPPAPQKGFPDPTSDHTPSTTDNGVGGAFLCGNNPASTTNAPRYLTSPVVDTAGAASLTLTFYRWLNSDSATYMASTVDVYDGTTWVNLYTNPTGSGAYVTDSAWSVVTYDLTAHANAALRVRFGFSALSASVYEMSSWNVDDVTVSTLACP
jgi:hypothetical protein